jgi:hypothetical protein
LGQKVRAAKPKQMDDTDKKAIKYVWGYELLFGNDRNRETARTLGLIALLVYVLAGFVKFIGLILVSVVQVLWWFATTREGQIAVLVLLAGYGLVRVGEDMWGPSKEPIPIAAPIAIATPITAPSAEASPSSVAVLPPAVAPTLPKPPDKLTLMNEVRPVLADSPIHKGPDLSTPIKDWVHAGSRVRILGEQGEFYVVRKLNGQFGFVRKEDIGDRL